MEMKSFGEQSFGIFVYVVVGGVAERGLVVARIEGWKLWGANILEKKNGRKTFEKQ